MNPRAEPIPALGVPSVHQQLCISRAVEAGKGKQCTPELVAEKAGIPRTWQLMHEFYHFSPSVHKIGWENLTFINMMYHTSLFAPVLASFIDSFPNARVVEMHSCPKLACKTIHNLGTSLIARRMRWSQAPLLMHITHRESLRRTFVKKTLRLHSM